MIWNNRLTVTLLMAILPFVFADSYCITATDCWRDEEHGINNKPAGYLLKTTIMSPGQWLPLGTSLCTKWLQHHLVTDLQIMWKCEVWPCAYWGSQREQAECLKEYPNIAEWTCKTCTDNNGKKPSKFELVKMWNQLAFDGVLDHTLTRHKS